MEKQVFKIKELKIDETGRSGVEAISFVSEPAIEENFEFFGKYIIPTILPFFKFTASPEPEIIPTSHNFCKEHAGKVYHESEINQWADLNHSSGDYYSNGWIQESNFFRDFNGQTSTSFSGSEQLYQCRHSLLRVTSMSEVPRNKWRYLDVRMSEEYQNGLISLQLSDEEKREVSGPVLVSNKMIYRNDVDGSGSPGYVFFSRDTVRKAMKKYGYCRTITAQHRDNITGSAILMDSWLEENDELNQTKWFCRYKILGNDLWEYVKAKKVMGFSVEALFTF